MKKIGSHVSFSKQNKYMWGAAKEAYSYGADSMMIYLGAPQNTKRVNPDEMFLKEYEEDFSSKIPKENIMVHAPYIINPSSIEKSNFAIEFLIKEISIMNYLGLKELVVHPGAHTKFSREESLKTLVNSLKEVLHKTTDVKILIETMAGKGTEVGTTFDEVVWIMKQVNSNRLGVCIDTCHIWEAGYDVDNVDKLIAKLKESGIYDYISAFHINNSKNNIGSAKDRHEQIEKGFISPDSLKKIANYKEFQNLNKILETPWENGQPPYKKEISFLKKI